MPPDADAIRTEMTGIVRQAVEVCREPTMKASVDAAARFLGLGPRRVRAYLHGEVRLVPAHEAECLRSRYRALLLARQRRLSAELTQLHALVHCAGHGG